VQNVPIQTMSGNPQHLVTSPGELPVYFAGWGSGNREFTAECEKFENRKSVKNERVEEWKVKE
jgi:hypothetical protein